MIARTEVLKMAARLRYATQVVAVAAAYFGAAKLGLLAAVAQPVVSSAWPPSGVALAALVLLGPRTWPGVALGAFLLNWTAGVPAAGAVVISAGNTLEAVTAVWLLGRVGFRPSLERLRDVVALVVLAALASTTLSATIGVTSLWASEVVTQDALPHLWFVWWSGDALGDILVAPLLLTWARGVRTSGRSGEAAALAALLVLLSVLLLRSPVTFVYAVFPVVLWAAVRFGPRGSATACAAIAGLTIWHTLHGVGPFVGSTPTSNLALLQTFLTLASATGLVLAAVTIERRTAEDLARESEQGLRRETAFVELLQVVAVAANEARSVDAALQTAVDEVCKVTGWAVGHVYLVAPEASALLRPAAIWHEDDAQRNAPFRRATATAPLALGVGLPGRVLASGRPAWILDAAKDANFPRATAAAESALRAGFAFPVLIGTDVVAVLEFFSHEAGAPDEALLDLMANVGTQLGRVIERERAAGALQEREALLGAMFDQTAVGVAVCDVDGRFVRTNRAFQQMLGYSAAELGSFSYADITHAQDLPRNSALMAELTRGDRPAFTLEKRYCRKDGTLIWAHVTVSALPGENGGPLLFVGMIEDITDRKHAQEQLDRHRGQLRDLAARLEAAREAERARIAREFHDELGQALTALKIDLTWLKRRLPQPTPELAGKLDGMEAILDGTAAAIQRIATELRPGVLDALGLPAAIQWQAREFAARTGIACEVELATEQPELDQSRATAAFRILQEALTNVARHAGASRVLVRFAVSAQTLELTVQDNGRGISDTALADQGSLGLLGIRERATNLGGTVAIAGTPDCGTTVTLTMPRAG